MFIGKVGEEERSIAFLVSCMNTGTSIKSFLQAFFLLSYVEFSCGHACDIINPPEKKQKPASVHKANPNPQGGYDWWNLREASIDKRQSRA